MREKLIFEVQGSADYPYEVKFYKDGNNLTAICDCPAGQNGLYCKHRFNILAGKSENVVSNNKKKIAIIVEWLKGTDVEGAIQSVHEAERVFDTAKKDLSAKKKQLARAMYD